MLDVRKKDKKSIVYHIMSKYFDSYSILFSFEPMVLLVHSGSVYLFVGNL